MNSKRSFKIVTLTPIKDCVIVEDYEVSFRDIVNDTEYETYFALQEIIDEVMDIPLGCSMYFQPNRDNIFSKGIIHRLT